MRGKGTGYKHEDLSSDPQNPLLGCGRQHLQLQQGRDGRVPESLWAAGLAHTAAMTRNKAEDEMDTQGCPLSTMCVMTHVCLCPIHIHKKTER